MTIPRIIRLHMAKLGKKGGKRRASVLTPEQRKAIARLGGIAKGINAAKRRAAAGE